VTHLYYKNYDKVKKMILF